MKYWVFDLETFKRCFSCVISDEEGNTHTFEISNRKREANELRRFLGKIYAAKDKMVGFNNLGFDYPILHYFLNNKGLTSEDIYNKAMEIINGDFENRFQHIISERDTMIPQIDLFKIHHFDNKAKSTSLKMLEFNMRSENISDLPYPPDAELTSEQIDEVLEYNKHDVLQTLEFFKHSKSALAFREELSEKYGRNFMNHNDTKIGKDYFIMELEKEMPGSCYKQVGGKRVINQTQRSSIKIKDIIFSYVKFDRPEFNAVLEWFKKQSIKETKGVFTDIEEHYLGELAKYSKLTQKNKKLKSKPTESQIKKMKETRPLCWIEEKPLKTGGVSYYQCWNIAESLNVVVDGFKFDYGTGGLHGSIESSIVKSDDEYVILDFDYASMYPNIAIANGIYPAHLSSKFCEIYKDVYEQRKSFKKGSPENAMLKLALNGVYGDSNNKYSPFYDPQYTISVTINGQLTLCGLAEKLLNIESLSIIQVNTDGITVRVKRELEKVVDQVVSDWDKVCGLTMEKVEYKAMYIRDVNSYISEYTDGKLKRKGAYCVETSLDNPDTQELPWHKNHSSIVVQKAAVEFLTKSKSIEEFIKNHDDIMDFMLRTKVPRTSRLVTVDDQGKDHKEQNICRYYISNNGRKLVKIMPPLKKHTERFWQKYDEYLVTTKDDDVKKAIKNEFIEVDITFEEALDDESFLPLLERRMGVDKEWLVTTCNNMKDFAGDINYDYYISEAKKLVDPLLSKD